MGGELPYIKHNKSIITIIIYILEVNRNPVALSQVSGCHTTRGQGLTSRHGGVFPPEATLWPL